MRIKENKKNGINYDERTLPRSIDSERLVLGTIMMEKGALSEIRDLLTDKSFYNEFHREIFRSIKSIETRGDRPDMVSVSDELRKKGDFDMIQFLEIAQSFTFDLYQHAAIIHDKEKRRRFYEIGQYLISNAYLESEDIVDVLSKANDMLTNIFESSAGNVSSISDAIKGVYKQIEKNASNDSILTGTPTGFHEFDRKSGGLQKSDLIIIAAETSQGKTSLALSISKNAALLGNRLVIYSMEMKKEQLAARLMSMESGVPANEILFSRLQPYQFEKIDKSISGIYNSCILFDDRSTSNIDTIISSIRTMVLKYNIEGVIIDYLQILNVNMKGASKEQQMGDVARRLKNLAKELDIWIIALSQLNRDSSNPIPNLNRLRDSGQIAEAADVVMFVYRPEAYGKYYPDPFQNQSTSNTAMIEVAKGRNIGLLKFICGFDKMTTHFVDLNCSSKNNNIITTNNVEKKDNTIEEDTDEDMPF